MDFWNLANTMCCREDGKGLDQTMLAEMLGVSEDTIRRWRRAGQPRWAELALEAHRRAIPNNKDWDGFRFAENRLHTPFKGLNFSATDLLHIFYERQFAAIDQAAKRKLKMQLDAVCSEEERLAILDEIETVKRSLDAVKNSPLLVRSWQGQPVKRK